MKKTVCYFMLMCVAFVMAACSSEDVIDVVPSNSIMLMSIDVPHLAEAESGVDARLLRTLLRVSSPEQSGIDMSRKMYVFETIEGSMGLAASVRSADEVGKWLTNMQRKGMCSSIHPQKDKHFAVLDRLWVVGYDDKTLLVMGPVLPASQPTMMRQMGRMMDDDTKMSQTQMYRKLQDIDAPMTMVAQARALPDQLVALCTTGIPEGTSPDKVMLSATIAERDGCLHIQGRPFSFDETVDAALQKASAVYRTLDADSLPQIPSSAIYAILANVDGKSFLPLLKANKQMNALLSGASAKVDLDAFVGNIDGNMVFAFLGNMDNMSLKWAAQMRTDAATLDQDSRRWLEANRLSEARDGDSVTPLPVRQAVVGRRMATIINLGAMKNYASNEARSMGNSHVALLPLNMFGNSQYIIFTLQE